MSKTIRRAYDVTSPCRAQLPIAYCIVAIIGSSCSLPVSGQAAPVGNGAEPGARLAATKCAACHGADGNGAVSQYPKLAGQDSDYLYRQMWAFKTGRRSSKPMSGIAAMLSDAEITDVASFFAKQAVRADRVTDPGLRAEGERIFHGNAGPGRGPACVMCHGQDGQAMPMMGMMSMMAPVPALNGQHSAYIIDQLHRFASGERQGMMMGRIAASLSERDIRAVAEFLATSP